jgi:hypothetical protein
MKQITVNVYSFKELSEKAKEKAMDKYFHIEQLWYSDIYDQAKSIDISIESFDLYRKDIEVKNLSSYSNIACKVNQMLSFIDLGEFKPAKEDLDLHKETKEFIEKYNTFANELELTNEWLEIDRLYDSIKELEMEYKGYIEGYYLACLVKQYDWMHSQEYIQDYFEANEYQFNEDGFVIY